jgi:hypothetical protein
MEAKQQPSHVVDDSTDAISITYTPIGLTAILADRFGRVSDIVRHLPGNDRYVETGLRSLAGASSGSTGMSPSQSGNVSPAS